MSNQTGSDRHTKEIAQIILLQLYTRRTEMWAWGATKLTYLERDVEGVKHPALMFSIRTPKIKRGGKVIISLDEGTDSYIVEAIRVRNDEETSLGVTRGIYCDMLHNTINELIEDKETFNLAIF